MPSTGCALCRQRRVKCDEAKPGCNRCSKIGKPCPGYDRGLRLVFYGGAGKPRRDTPLTFTTEDQPSSTDDVVEQPASARRVRKHGQRRQQHHQTPITLSCDSVILSSLEESPSFPEYTNDPQTDAQLIPIRPSLTSDIDIRAISLFNSSFIADSRSQSGDPTFLDFLPDLYLNSSPDSCLRHTLTAVAHLNFLNRYKASDTLSEWIKHSYGRGLRATNHALSSPSLAATDETLTAVWILSMYELLDPTMTPTGQRTAWTNHVSGTLALLRIRGKDQLLTRTGRHLFLLMSTPIIAMNMMLGEKPLRRIAELNRLMIEIDPDESSGPGLAHAFIHRVATVRSELRAWIEAHRTSLPSDSDLSDLQTIINSDPSLLVDQTDYELWTLDKPAWQPKKIPVGTTTTTTTSPLSSTPEYTHYAYTSTHIMSQWLIVWTTKLLHRQTLLDSLTLQAKISQHLGSVPSSSSPSADTTQLFKDQVLSNADHLLGSVAYAFGDVDPEGNPTSPLVATASSAYSSSAVGAYHMFWPMGAVVASPYTSPRQKRLARLALKGVGERFCVAQALKYVVGVV